MRITNLVLKFLLEMAGVAALACTGAAIGSGLWAVVLAVALPVVAIAVWGRWNARLGLLVTGAVVWAVVYLVLVVINAAMLTVLRQWEA